MRTIPAAEIITRICRELSYSRAHVAKIMRSNAAKLRASWNAVEGQWHLPAATGEKRLRDLVRQQSGRRYKLGEKGPHRQAA